MNPALGSTHSVEANKNRIEKEIESGWIVIRDE